MAGSFRRAFPWLLRFRSTCPSPAQEPAMAPHHPDAKPHGGNSPTHLPDSVSHPDHGLLLWTIWQTEHWSLARGHGADKGQGKEPDAV